MFGGEIYVKKIPSVTLEDISKQLLDCFIKTIGIRPGEKHEEMINENRSQNTYDFRTYYESYQQVPEKFRQKMISAGTKVKTWVCTIV